MQRLQGGSVVTDSNNNSVIARYFQTNLVVVEVMNGETQEEAWRRFVADNPEGAGASVKIFHFPEPRSLKKRNSEVLQLHRRENGP